MKTHKPSDLDLRRCKRAARKAYMREYGAAIYRLNRRERIAYQRGYDARRRAEKAGWALM